jgi:hypothetical protein
VVAYRMKFCEYVAGPFLAQVCNVFYVSVESKICSIILFRRGGLLDCWKIENTRPQSAKN